MKNLLIIFLLSAPFILQASDKKALTKKSSSKKGFVSLPDLPPLEQEDIGLDDAPQNVISAADYTRALVKLVRTKYQTHQSQNFTLRAESIVCQQNIATAIQSLPSSATNGDRLTKTGQRIKALEESKTLNSNFLKLLGEQEKTMTEMMAIIDRMYSQK